MQRNAATEASTVSSNFRESQEISTNPPSTHKHTHSLITWTVRNVCLKFDTGPSRSQISPNGQPGWARGATLQIFGRLAVVGTRNAFPSGLGELGVKCAIAISEKNGILFRFYHFIPYLNQSNKKFKKIGIHLDLDTKNLFGIRRRVIPHCLKNS